MSRVLFTPSAIEALQRLDGLSLERVLQVLPGIAEEKESLSSGQFVVRREDVFLLLAEDPAGDPVITWAGHEIPEFVERFFPPWPPESWPAFEWSGRGLRRFAAFVRGAYRSAPRPTANQQDVIRDLQRSLKHDRHRQVHLVEGGPGAGKTLSTLLAACSARQVRPDIQVAYIAPEAHVNELRRMAAVQKAFGDRASQAVCTAREWFSRQVGSEHVHVQDAATAVMQSPPAPSAGLTLIVLDGLESSPDVVRHAVLAAWNALLERGAGAVLWITSDPDQPWAVQPFDEDAPVIRHTLYENHRNAPSIQSFARQLLSGGLADVQDGAIALLTVNSREEGAEAIKKLRATYADPAYLRHRAGVLPVVMGMHRDDLQMELPEDVVGRTFETAIGLHVFAGTGDPTELERGAWYMLVSRIQKRLLLLVLPEELSRLSDELAGRLQLPDLAAAADWLHAGEDLGWLASSPGEALRILSEPDNWPGGLPFRDTWHILRWFGIPPAEWEHGLKSVLTGLDRSKARALVRPEQNAWLRCLGYRLLGEWTSAERQVPLIGGDSPYDRSERERLYHLIAEALEATGRPFEAARVRSRHLGEPWPEDLPFATLGTDEGDLFSLLVKHVSAALTRPSSDD